MIDVAIMKGNIRKKEHEKLEKYQGLRKELKKMWRVKVKVVPVVVRALSAVIHKLVSGSSNSLDQHLRALSSL